jgi:hypothetical protein
LSSFFLLLFNEVWGPFGIHVNEDRIKNGYQIHFKNFQVFQDFFKNVPKSIPYSERPLTGFKWQFTFIEFPPEVEECNLIILLRQYYMKLKIQLEKLDSSNIYEFSFPNGEACAASLLEIIQSGPPIIQNNSPFLESTF